jgi:hypothetical protein
VLKWNVGRGKLREVSCSKFNRTAFNGYIEFFFYCCTVHFDNVQDSFYQQMHSLLTYKMLKLTIKISVYLLLHVSVHSDHRQGAYTDPC